MKLLIEIELGIVGNRIAYNNVRTTFDLDVDIQPFAAWMYNPLFDYRDRLRESVCAGVREACADMDTWEASPSALSEDLSPFWASTLVPSPCKWRVAKFFMGCSALRNPPGPKRIGTGVAAGKGYECLQYDTMSLLS